MAAPDTLFEGLKRNAKTCFWVGILQMVAGSLALLAPQVAGVSLTLVLGVLLILAGIAEIILAFGVGALGQGLLLGLVGVLSAVVGGYVLSQPIAALLSLTLILAAYFFVAGLFEVAAALRLRPNPGWGWMALSGVLTFVLGVFIYIQFPLSGAWAIGVLFGIKLLLSGATMTALSAHARRALTGRSTTKD